MNYWNYTWNGCWITEKTLIGMGRTAEHGWCFMLVMLSDVALGEFHLHRFKITTHLQRTYSLLTYRATIWHIFSQLSIPESGRRWIENDQRQNKLLACIQIKLYANFFFFSFFSSFGIYIWIILSISFDLSKWFHIEFYWHFSTL